MIKYICLPSGGFNLFKYLGILSVFHKNNLIDFDGIEGYYGVSAGGILSSILCLNLDLNTIIKYFIERTWHKTYNMDKINIINYFNEKGIVDKPLFTKLIEPLFKSCDLDINAITMKEFYEKTGKKLSLFAVNALNYELTEFNYATTPDILLLDALYFTSCIPAVFKPYEYNDIFYFDGGFYTKSPVDLCLKNEGIEKDEIFAIDCDYNPYKQMPITKDDDFITFIYNIMVKMYINNLTNIVANDIPYLIHLNTVSYEKHTLIKITESRDVRNEIYLDGVRQGEEFVETLKPSDVDGDV